MSPVFWEWAAGFFHSPPGYLLGGQLPSGIIDQAEYGADFAGKPSPEGTKVLIMELFKLGGLANITEKGNVKVRLRKDDQEKEQNQEESDCHKEQTEDT